MIEIAQSTGGSAPLKWAVDEGFGSPVGRRGSPRRCLSSDDPCGSWMADRNSLPSSIAVRLSSFRGLNRRKVGRVYSEAYALAWVET